MRSSFVSIALVLAGALAGCSDDPSDVVGPFTGEALRYRVDRIDLPRGRAEGNDAGDDLNGDGVIDNQLADIGGLLRSEGNLTDYGADMIASGVIASYVDVQTDSFTEDDTVSVAYVGAAGEPATAVGGRIRDRVFASNRTLTTRVPGAARVHLPILPDVDPAVLDVSGVEIDLTPDGQGGFDGVLRGVLDPTAALTAAYRGVVAMFTAFPADHRELWTIIDANLDGEVTLDEFKAAAGFVVAPDIQYGGHQVLSIGFRFHLTPCPGGACPALSITDRCHDRVRDGAESDIDCGDGCLPCAGALRCDAPSDCWSNTCAAATCTAPTCADGAADGFESDVDCGGPCDGCPSAADCAFDSDCLSDRCYNGRCL